VPPRLPYQTIAGIVPCPGGWLIAPARLAGVTVNAEPAFVVAQFVDVLDYKPKFDAAAVFAPIGLNDEPSGRYRPCDREAREIVGWPRRVGFHSVPSRRALLAPTRAEALAVEPWLTKGELRMFKWWREVEHEVQPFHQRTFFAAHPDLTLTMLNDDRPLHSSPYQHDGVLERLALIRNKLPGIDEIVLGTPPIGAGQVHVLQAAALVWTARRAAGRAMSRLPMEPVWDSTGLRMELAR
jgi:predicted RNase H-like nuclease